MNLIKPKALKKGDTIGVFAPSSIANPDHVNEAKTYIISQGYNVKVHEQTFAQNGNHAGTNEDKIQALHDLFLDDSVDAIFCARGGNGLLQYIDELDYGLIGENIKPVVGFSDVTVLHNALLNKVGMASFHGPIFQLMREGVFLPSTENCLKTLNGNCDYDLFELAQNQDSDYPLTIANQGIAEGRLVGGNLSLLSELTKATEFKPQFSDNIVFFEDTEDFAYKHDRLLAGLFLNHNFRQAAGFVVGVSKIDPDEEAGEFKHPRHTFPKIMQFYLNKYSLDIPVVTNAPISHGQPNQIIPHGAQARLDATGKIPTLKLLESPFAP